MHESQTIEKERERLKKQTVYRDEKGRAVDKSQTKEAKKKELEIQSYKNMEKWAKGIIQKEEELQNKIELIKAKEEPFARYDLDESRDLELQNKSRFGDPMKDLIAIHNYDRGDVKIGIQDRNIERGFYLPKCKFVAPANRFGIEPGYRWDGVDRSTGFEVKYLKSLNMGKAREEEYHKIRTEDM